MKHTLKLINFLIRYSYIKHFPPFPTRRSSDLSASSAPSIASAGSRASAPGFTGAARTDDDCAPGSRQSRSEEHTSELQSHSDLVCSLLLEKKNKNLHKYEGTYITEKLIKSATG